MLPEGSNTTIEPPRTRKSTGLNTLQGIMEYRVAPDQLVRSTWSSSSLLRINEVMDRTGIDSLFENGKIDKPIESKVKALVQGKAELVVNEKTPKINLILEIEEEIPEGVDKNIFWKNVVALQMTYGCNGGCRFCMFGSKENSGIQAVFTKESVEKAIEKINEAGGEALLYLDSDPLDDPDLPEIAKHEREITGKSTFISTSIPEGSISTFVELARMGYEHHMATKGTGTLDENYPKGPITIRLSVGKHNIKRAQYAIVTAMKTLVEEGATLEDTVQSIDHIILEVADRTEHNYLLGNDIEHPGRSSYEVLSPTCLDGIVAAPEKTYKEEGNYKAKANQIMMTAATKYSSSGVYYAKLEESQELIQRVDIHDYRRQDNTLGEEKYHRFINLGCMLPVIKAISGEDFELKDPVENVCLHLSRDALTYATLMRDIRDAYFPEKLTPLDEEYFTRVTQEYGERKKRLGKYKEEVERIKDSGTNGAIIEKIEYYEELATVFEEGMDILVEQIKEKRPTHEIRALCFCILNSNPDNIDKLPESITIVGDAIKHIQDRKLEGEDAQKLWAQELSKIWPEDQIPEWARR
ncbi:hypothetical protein COT52_01555 [candidate division WWE3 bacterium CG08_land_8_20_14_0_20_43_13]|uniref:Radical SAM core domain-containing protein n=1 Tax=candidate division WWE3 bacterium CG08_land_8_20_14_0_20_43_13 TaxID=1975087 RepID=A0A2H0X7G7_UNCKA|nr:MAG: hypothetical protein COT52_01555 [candidate division WWE3 bacterium CG08_land_8_20_14_0_20_43_13]